MEISTQQIDAVNSLSGSDRYQHFIKRVADGEELWGLFDDGWAIASDDAARHALPVWAAREYANLSTTGDWAAYQATRIDLYDFLDEILPDLREKQMTVVVMMTPNESGVFVDPDRLQDDIRAELENY